MKELKTLLKQDFPYLDSSKGKFLLIGFVALYSFIFIVVYKPFNINQWGEKHYLEYVMIGASTILVSQFIFRPVLGLKKFKGYSMFFWCLFEMILMTYVLYLFYSPVLLTLDEKISEFIVVFGHTSLIISVPYVLIIGYLWLANKLAQFKAAQHNTILSPPNKENKLLVIKGENEKVILAIKYPQLLYVKSAGNYLELYYLKREKLTKELVRASLKELEEKIIDTNVIRIHRSYMVNVAHISSFKKTRKGYNLVIQDILTEIIPVSSGYKSSFEEILKQKMSHSSQDGLVLSQNS